MEHHLLVERRLRFDGSEQVTTIRQLRHISCVILVGAAGLGKSTLMRREFASVLNDGGLGRFVRLDQFPTDQDLIEAVLPMPNERRSLSMENRWNLYFDGFDESGDQPQTLVRRISLCIRRIAEIDTPLDWLSIKVSTRNLELAQRISEVISPIFTPGGTCVVVLQDLNDEEIDRYVGAAVSDAHKFVESIKRDTVLEPLARRPLTLTLLIELYRAHGRLPDSHRELYRTAISALLRSAGVEPEATILSAAKLAAVMTLSNRLTLWTGDDPAGHRPTSLLMQDLNTGTETAPAWLISALVRSGLLEQTSPNELRWFHHSIAEYLTALQIDASGMPPDEALKILQTRILGKPALRTQLKDIAAWLAASRHDFLDVLIEADADVFLSSDVSIIDHGARKAIVASLLASASARAWYGFVDMGPKFARLFHPDLADQLRDHLLGGAATKDSSLLAIEIGRACRVRELVSTFSNIALNQGESVEARALAVHAVDELGSDDDRRMLLPLTLNAGRSDVDDEVRGAALSVTWPRVLTAGELFGRLALPRDPERTGALRYFLYRLNFPELDRDGALAAISWLSRSPADYFQGTLGGPAQRALVRAWHACDDPVVLNAFAKLLFSHAEDRSPALGNLDTADLDVEIREGSKERRRSLFHAIVREMTGATGSASRFLPLRILALEDLEWLISDLRDDAVRAQIGDMLLQAVIWLLRGCNDIRDVEHVWDASENIPELAEALANAFTISLDSETARLMRQSLEHERRRQEKNAPKVGTVVEQFDSLCKSFDAGDQNAWWLANIALLVDESGTPNELKSPLDEGVLWHAMNESQRTAALRMATQYVKHLRLANNWLKPNQHHRPAVAAYRAVRLLFKYEPETVERLIDDGVVSWILPAIAFRANDTQEEVVARTALLKTAFDRQPGHFVEAIDHAVAALGGQFVDDLASLVGPWAGEVLLDKMWSQWSSHPSEGTLRYSAALRLFAKRGYEPLRRVFDEALEAATETGEADEWTLGIADAMFDGQAATAKSWMLPLLREHRKLAADIFQTVIGYWTSSVHAFLKSLSDAESVEVYSFAKENIPAPPEQHGAYTVTPLHSVDQLRQRLLKELADRGTDSSITALLTLRDRYRDQPWLQYYVDEGLKIARDRSTDWMAPVDVIRIVVLVASSIVTELPAVPIAEATTVIEGATEDIFFERIDREDSQEENVRFTFLLFATEWSSGHGGLSTINRELAKGLALAGQAVFCFVPRPKAEEDREAEAVGVRLLPGTGPDFMSVAEQLALGPDLPNGLNIDFVIGHDHITGPAACVWAQRIEAGYVHVVHTHPDEIASAKLGGGDPRIFERADDKRNLQLELSRKAKLVVAVGPLLTNYITTHVRNAVRVSRLDPGLTEDLLADVPDSAVLLEASCLFMGRGDDLLVKGIDRLAEAVRLMRAKVKGSRTQPPIITFRGYADEASIEEHFGSGHRLRFHGFSANRDEVWEDLRAASLLLMPSRAEGFGLVAFEAISAGVPVLVSQESGVALLLRTLSDAGLIAQSLADEVIVESTGDLEADADVWSDRILRVMTDRATAFQRSLKLREGLRHMTWTAAVEGVLKSLRSC